MVVEKGRPLPGRGGAAHTKRLAPASYCGVWGAVADRGGQGREEAPHEPCPIEERHRRPSPAVPEPWARGQTTLKASLATSSKLSRVAIAPAWENSR